MGRGNRNNTKQVYIDPREAFKGSLVAPFDTSMFKSYKFDPNYSYEKYQEIRNLVINYWRLGGQLESQMFPFVNESDWKDNSDIIPIAIRKSEFAYHLVEELQPIFNPSNSDKASTIEYLHKNAFTEEFYRLGDFLNPEKFPLGEFRHIDFLFEYASKDKDFLNLWKRFLLDSNLDSGEAVSNQALASLTQVYQRCIEIDEATKEDVHPLYGVRNLLYGRGNRTNRTGG